MPVEIKELVIRTIVGPAAPGGATPPTRDEGLASATPVALTPADAERLLQDCVRQVMRLLARERER
ncbi:MAG: hypothetical protein KBC73_06295 [Burkholderiaceae bacterium]|nr:hypothetical protein [Burkholderiaceae bacterium]